MCRRFDSVSRHHDNALNLPRFGAYSCPAGRSQGTGVEAPNPGTNTADSPQGPCIGLNREPASMRPTGLQGAIRPCPANDGGWAGGGPTRLCPWHLGGGKGDVATPSPPLQGKGWAEPRAAIRRDSQEPFWVYLNHYFSAIDSFAPSDDPELKALNLDEP